ncbi:MAG: hypothetical protein AAFR59_03540 [Bacteroidota bacterium]
MIPLLPVVLLSFKKIDKISFFNHYFKVIEEVELRNSHALTDEGLAIWYAPAALEADVVTTFQTLYLWLWAAVLLTFSYILSSGIFHYRSSQHVLHPAVALRTLYPIRAP